MHNLQSKDEKCVKNFSIFLKTILNKMKKQKLFFLLIFLLTVQQIIISQSTIDSLKSFINSTEDSVQKLEALLELAQELKNTDNNEIIIYLDQADKLLGKYPDELKTANLDKFYANYYSYKGDYQKATEYFLRSISSAEKAGDFELRNSAMNGLAILNIRTKNFQKGIELFQELIDYSKETENEEDVIYYSLNIAMANAEAGNIPEAEKFFLDVFNSNPKNEFFKAVAANSLSFIYNNIGEYQKAYRYAKFAADFSENVPDAPFKIESLTNYSNALKGIGKNKLAEEIMFKIVELARENNFVREMNNALGNIALNYEAMGDYKSAYKYYKIFSEQKDSLLTEATAEKINELQIKYETEKKSKEIAEKTAALKERNIALFFAFALITVFGLAAVIVFNLYRKKNAAYKELVRKNLEIIRREDETAAAKNKLKSENKKYSSSPLKDDKKRELLEKIKTAVIDEKMFLQSDLTLGKLAGKLESNSKYVSQIIHEVYNLSFSDFINRLRVKEAARLLSDESYRHFSFEGISKLVGFKAKSSFNACFKKYMGVTPSFFSQASAEISE